MDAANAHDWRLDHSGQIEMFAWEYGYHNGPVCERCWASPCVSCEPDWESDECLKAWIEDWLAGQPDDWRRGPAIRRWLD